MSYEGDVIQVEMLDELSEVLGTYLPAGRHHQNHRWAFT
jgi:hypothetical protein